MREPPLPGLIEGRMRSRHRLRSRRALRGLDLLSPRRRRAGGLEALRARASRWPSSREGPGSTEAARTSFALPRGLAARRRGAAARSCWRAAAIPRRAGCGWAARIFRAVFVLSLESGRAAALLEPLFVAGAAHDVPLRDFLVARWGPRPAGCSVLLMLRVYDGRPGEALALRRFLLWPRLAALRLRNGRPCVLGSRSLAACRRRWPPSRSSGLRLGAKVELCCRGESRLAGRSEGSTLFC